MYIYPLLDIPKKSVLGLVDRSTKIILISGTTDPVGCISKWISQLRSKDVALNKFRANIRSLELIIIETLDSNATSLRIKEKTAEWMNYYKSIGYDLVGKRISLGYRLSVVINKDYKVEVSLITKGGLKKIVGLFDTESEARRFILRAYPDHKNINKMIVDKSVTNESEER